jgi:hypothetical protein
MIWIPQLIFRNSLEDINIVNDAFSTLLVDKESSAVLNSKKELQENEVFEGGFNPFVYQRIYDLVFKCEFGLAKYPFDWQLCFIQVRHFELRTCIPIRNSIILQNTLLVINKLSILL